MLAPTVTAAHAPLTHTSRPPVSACLQPEGGVAPELLEMMKEGGYFFKHDFGRAKRGRKHLKLSTDGLKITWKSVGMNEVVPEGSGTDRSSPSARSILRSASFSRTTSSEFFPHTPHQPIFAQGRTGCTRNMSGCARPLPAPRAAGCCARPYRPQLQVQPALQQGLMPGHRL